MTAISLQRHDFENGEALEMVLHINAHFAGLKRGNVIEITYLTPNGYEQGYDCNHGEYHPANDVRAALAAFDQRLAAGGWETSGLEKSLEDILGPEEKPETMIDTNSPLGSILAEALKGR